MRSLALLLLCLASSPALAENSPCAQKTYAGEDLLRDNDLEAAEPLLKEAVELCTQAQATSARPFIALGTLYFRTHRWADAIPLFHEALEREPGLPLAYMNLSAAHQQLKQFPEAIEAGKKAITLAKKNGDRSLQAKANYNVGFALFSEAAANAATNDLRSEEYFKESRDLDPSIAGNYFYLGIIAQVMRNEITKARNYFKRGCDLKYAPACQSLEGLGKKK